MLSFCDRPTFVRTERRTMQSMCIYDGLVKLAVSSGAVSSVLLYCCTAPLLAVASSGQ